MTPDNGESYANLRGDDREAMLQALREANDLITSATSEMARAEVSIWIAAMIAWKDKVWSRWREEMFE